MTSGGDWVEQARRLMESLRAAGPDTPAADPGTPGAIPAGTTAPGDCRWCPLCQAAAVVRGERPELTAALADILAATATALRQFAGQPAAPQEEDAAPEQPPAPPPAVQRIELS
jgi:hypothetical protein